jgi:hypothetical protein
MQPSASQTAPSIISNKPVGLLIEKIDAKLQYIYITTTFLCLFMLTWILLMPGAAFLNSHQPGWREKQVSIIDEGSSHFPPKLLTKYEGETLVAYTHIFPAALWIMAIPLQFHPSIRRKYRKTHRLIGRIFVYLSFLIMIGFVIILYRGLSYENYLEGKEPFRIPGTSLRIVDAALCMLAARFLYCVIVAVNFAKANEFQQHQYWMIRHCSLGMWVVVQRFLGVILTQLYGMMYDIKNITASGAFQGLFFLGIGIFGIVMSVATGEYTILLLKKKVLVKSKCIN